MADMSVISFGAQCWVSKLIRELWPDQQGATGVFDSIGTCPSMVAHILVDDYNTLCNPAMYRVVGRHEGCLQNVFYEDYLKDQVQMHLNQSGLSLADFGLHAYTWEVPPLSMPNTENGVFAMCDTLRQRGRRMTEQLNEARLKVLLWGVALPYNHYVRLRGNEAPLEEMMQEELRILYHSLQTQVGVEAFCLVGLMVIHGCPQKDMVADEQFAVTPIFRDMFVTMKKIGVTSKLKGEKWKGHAWADEKNDIFRFISNCENMMFAAAAATVEMQSPYPYEVPRTSLAMPILGLAAGDSDVDEADDSFLLSTD